MNKIRLLKIFVLSAASMFWGAAANADVIDFKAMAEPGGSHGESIWNPLSIIGSDFNLDITATKNGNSAYAYLDAGNAGLGVCGAPTATGLNKLNSITNSGSNLCSPSSDDNTTVGEALSFVFDVDVLIQDIWLNNNHDDDASLFGDTVNVGGSAITFGTNNGGPADYFVGQSFFVNAGTSFVISYNNEQFYVSGMEVNAAVPEPSVLLLMLAGLLLVTGSSLRFGRVAVKV